ncbi:MAG: N-acetyltransferase [Aestuariivirga sp.]
MMNFPSLPLVTEQHPQDQAEIETLLDLAFGIGRRTKTSYRLREGNVAAAGLSLIVREDGFGIVGSISFWPVLIGEAQTSALLLGPLAIHPQRQNLGIGRSLLHDSLARAKTLGHKLIILIGDAPYYLKAGFQYAPVGQIEMPGPVDPKRLLYLELETGMLAQAHGMALPPYRWKEIIALRAATSD